MIVRMFGLIPGESMTRILKTEWVFGVTTNNGSGLNSNDIIREVRYPDPSTGASSSTEKETISVNALGQKLTVTDRNGTTHSYSYDTLSRPIADAVTTLGSGVDGTVRRITTGYSPLGQGYLFTCYDAASGGNVINQVKDECNGLGQVTKEWQEHGGAVTGSSANVQYAYSEVAGGANHSRLTGITYASGYVLNYNYGSGLDSTISRLTSLGDSGNTLESYSYLGLATIVKRAHPQSGVDLSYIKLSGESVGDAGDPYTGLDRFQRIVDHRWINGSNVDLDRYKYGYDRNGNRLFKENGVLASLSEVSSYDDLNQLASYKLGTLNTGKTDVTGTPTNAQSWDYDAVGNWDSVTTNSTTQTRGANRQNEITSIGGATTPTYDNNGNLTKDENNNRLVWDAWNMMVQVRNASNVVIVSMGRDALHRHVTDTEGTSLKDRFFGLQWQVFEIKAGSTTVTRLVWSPAYVDGMVLRDRDTDSNGTMDERIYPLQDANWNTTALLISSGTVVERYTYSPFGEVTFRDASGSVISSSVKDWIFLHQGGEKIAVGVYEFRNRIYSPTLGRWLSNDPLGFEAGDVNNFRYLKNNTLNNLDPIGLIDFLPNPQDWFPRPGGPGRNCAACHPIAPWIQGDVRRSGKCWTFQRIFSGILSHCGIACLSPKNGELVTYSYGINGNKWSKNNTDDLNWAKDNWAERIIDATYEEVMFALGDQMWFDENKTFKIGTDFLGGCGCHNCQTTCTSVRKTAEQIHAYGKGQEYYKNWLWWKNWGL